MANRKVLENVTKVFKSEIRIEMTILKMSQNATKSSNPLLKTIPKMSSKSGPRIESWQSNKCVKIKSPEKVQLRRIDLRGKLEKMNGVIRNSDLEVSVLKRS